jgi:hypothetical protein
MMDRGHAKQCKKRCRTIFNQRWVRSMTIRYLMPIILLTLSSCASTPATQIKAFGDSTKAVSDGVDAVFDDYNDAVLMRKLTDYAATYQGGHAVDLTSQLVAELAPPLTDQAKKNLAVFRANQALGDYAQALGDLAMAASSADFDMAAVKLYGAMTSFNQEYQDIRADGKELFNADDFEKTHQVFAAIGALALERKRKRAIKHVVISADPKIGVLCDLIDQQLEASGIRDGIKQARKNVLTEELKDYKAMAKGAVDLEWRRAKMARLNQLHQGVQSSAALINNAQAAIREVKKSHAILAAELRKDNFNSKAIAESVARLKELKKRYDEFEKS